MIQRDKRIIEPFEQRRGCACIRYVCIVCSSIPAYQAIVLVLIPLCRGNMSTWNIRGKPMMLEFTRMAATDSQPMSLHVSQISNAPSQIDCSL